MYERQTKKQKEVVSKNQRVPKAVDTLNLSRQIQNHCASIDSYANDSLSKLYLVAPGDQPKQMEKTIQNLSEAMTGA